MKLGKAANPDNVSVELLEAFEDYTIDKLATLLNKIYDTCKFHKHFQIYIYRTAEETRGNRV